MILINISIRIPGCKECKGCAPFSNYR